MRTAPNSDKATQYFTIIHPFHPWLGRRLELIDSRRRWGQWRVYYLTETGETGYVPAAWTDVGGKDAFVEQAQGRAIARIEDLLELVKVIRGSVKPIKPQSSSKLNRSPRGLPQHQRPQERDNTP